MNETLGKKCPCCGNAMMGVEYAWNDKFHYDGISEWACDKCGIRIGRWSNRMLFGEDRQDPRDRFLLTEN